jgi:hypothetical protein
MNLKIEISQDRLLILNWVLKKEGSSGVMELSDLYFGEYDLIFMYQRGECTCYNISSPTLKSVFA